MDFFAKLDAAIDRNESLLCVGLDPVPERIPSVYRSSEAVSSILAWNRAVIAETKDLVCAYKPNIAFYEALGQAGMDLLRTTLTSIPDDIPILLDAKRGDMGNTAQAYARACFDELGVDAVTLSPYLGKDSIDPFAAYSDKGLFVLCHTSNPSAGEFQHLEISDWQSLDRYPNQPLYLHVAKQAIAWSHNVGLVVGATYPDALQAVRAVAPEAWFLVPGIGAQGGDLESTMAAGLRSDTRGLIVNVSRGVCLADSHRAAAERLRTQINRCRTSPPTAIAQAKHDAVSPQLRDLVIGLADLGAVQFGRFTLASGAEAPFYIDLRLLVSRPQLLGLAADAYAAMLADIVCDRVAGVPYAALPIGTAVSMTTDIPLIYPRKETKAYGLGRGIEGTWQSGERVAVIEDLITSGGSIVKSAETLRAAGLIVEDAVVLIDREQGGTKNLAEAGIRAHAVLKLHQVLDILVSAGRLSREKQAEVLDFVR